MKTLYIFRHAKSSWDLPVADKDRPLALKGIKDAHLMGSHLAGKLSPPQVCLSSPANRALHTAVILCKQLQIPSEQIKITDELYDFYGDNLLKVIRAQPKNLSHLMLFGHNNAITNIVNILGDREIANVSTCGFVELVFDVAEWYEVQTGVVKQFIKPKALK